MRIEMMKQVLFVVLFCGSLILRAQETPAPTPAPTPEAAPAVEPAPTPEAAPAVEPAPVPTVTPEPVKEPPAAAPVSAPATKPTPRPVPLRATEITAVAIRDTAPRTLPDALGTMPGLFFRDAGAGLSYPVLRGMPSGSVPVIFDGIPLGGTVFTGGTGAWLSLLDRRLAERITVTNGPDTVLGSAAAAGGSVTIQPFTSAVVRGTPELVATGRFNTRFSSADTDRDAHARIAAGYGDFGALAAGSVAFNDARVNGARTEEPFSALETYGAFFAGDWVATRDAGNIWHLNFGYLFGGMGAAADTTALAYPTDAPDTVSLYDRMAHVAWGRLFMGIPDSALQGTITLSYQNAFERADTLFIGNGRSIWHPQEREETTGHTAGLDIDFTAGVVPGFLTLKYGGQYYRDFIGTAHFERTDTVPLARTGIAAIPDGSTYDRFSGHILGEFELLSAGGPHRLKATAGYRFEGSALRAPFRDDIHAVNLTDPGHAAEASLSYSWREALGAALTYGHGTRAPSLREAAYYGICDGLFIVPNGGLDPEMTDTADLTLRGQTKRLSLSLSGFATHIADRIGRVSASWGNLREINGFPVAGYVNTGRALIWGITSGGKLTTPFGLTVSAGATYLWGEERLKNDAVAPLDHIPPLLWNTSLRWSSLAPGAYQGFAELTVRGSTGSGPREGIAAGTVDPSFRMYGWQSVTVRGGFVFDEYIRVIVAIENLFDRYYRPYQAGIAASGISGTLSFDAEF
jgi:hypothetical protein